LNGINITTVTRDDQGNIIPPSQRFQPTEEDIRYETIRSITGWIVNPYDGKLRWEIPDNEAKFINRDNRNIWVKDRRDINTVQGAKIEDVLDHPQLFEAYPELKGTRVSVSTVALGSDAVVGYYDKNPTSTRPHFSVTAKNLTNAMSGLLHEIQHWIQDKEGFSRGTSPQAFSSAPEIYRKWLGRRELMDLSKELGVSPIEAVERYRDLDEYEERKLDAELWRQDPEMMSDETINKNLKYFRNRGKTDMFTAYERTAGEIESRDVQSRMKMTPEQRKAIAPYTSENINPDDVVVMGGEGGVSRLIRMPRSAGMAPKAVTTKLESLGFGRGGIVSVVNQPDASFEGRTI
ncbi:MAG: hypothetical protein EBR82_87925, partial [Caulobacteraceae bacterium]|nr:hypothetical protein [Caulobacteraceae bacterium]